MNEVNIAVTGAAGQIAYQLIPSLLKGEVFGERTMINLSLIDIAHVQDRVQGVIMELEDGAYPLLASVSAYSDEELDVGFKEIDFAFLVGSMPRQKGMERSDLLEKNGKIFTKQGKALGQFAKKSVKVLVVGNPCNTNCLIAMQHAESIPNEQFFAMTMLDEHRAKSQVAKHLQVSINDIEGLHIYGNHSATQYPDYENIRVHGAKIKEDDWFESTFIAMIQQRGAEVIQARGASSAASAAHAAITTAKHIINQSRIPFSVAKISHGEFHSPEGLVVSMPCIFEDGICKAFSGFQHSSHALKHMMYSYDELRNEYQQVKQMGLI